MTTGRSATDPWTLGPADGELLIRTGVAGRAARLGHRLTLAITRWQASVGWVGWVGSAPATGSLAVQVDSIEVRRGQGGVKGLSGPEKALARLNALKSLSASRFPDIRFTADAVDATADGYRLTGTLEIRGTAREHVVHLRTEDLGDSWRLSTESGVRQSDYGIKAFSILMGSVKVADEVVVSFTAIRAKDD